MASAAKIWVGRWETKVARTWSRRASELTSRSTASWVWDGPPCTSGEQVLTQLVHSLQLWRLREIALQRPDSPWRRPQLQLQPPKLRLPALHRRRLCRKGAEGK